MTVQMENLVSMTDPKSTLTCAFPRSEVTVLVAPCPARVTASAVAPGAVPEMAAAPPPVPLFFHAPLQSSPSLPPHATPNSPILKRAEGEGRSASAAVQ